MAIRIGLAGRVGSALSWRTDISDGAILDAMQCFKALSAQLKSLVEESRDPTPNGLRPLLE